MNFADSDRNWLTDYEKLIVTKEDSLGRGKERLSGWDGNVVELGCHDGCTTINIIKFIDLKMYIFQVYNTMFRHTNS